jgi:hypothetical protein
MDAGCESCPKTKAISWRKSADGSLKPFASARTAGTAVGRSGGEARSRRPNIALYRTKSGNLVSRNAVSRSSIDSAFSIGGAGSIDAKSLCLLVFFQLH